MADRSGGGDARRGNYRKGRPGDRQGRQSTGRRDGGPQRGRRDGGSKSPGQPPVPTIPDDIQATDLDSDVRRDLVSLPKELADLVARHIVAAGTLLEDDPARALQHARFARSKAPRIAAVREAAGLAAYRAGEWAEALAELRAARRISGGPGHLPVLADVERALGRPERALDLARSPEARQLDDADRIELLIVTAGARRDLGELDAAVVSSAGARARRASQRPVERAAVLCARRQPARGRPP